MGGFRPYREEEPTIIPLSVEEVKLLKNTPVISRHQVMKDMVIFFTDTGARWEDGQGLRVKSVDIIGQQVNYTQLKNGKRRVVILEQQLLLILNSRIRGKDSENLVFTSSKGNVVYYSDFHKFLKKLARSAGITKRVSPHVLRHSYAQNLYDQTGDIYLVQDVLGHKSLSSTLIYLRNSGKRIKHAQQMHPHLAENITPQLRIGQIEDELEKHKLEEDEKFDHLKVKKATNDYILRLHEAIR